MQTMRFFVDTHSIESETFPEGLGAEDFRGFYAKYLEACQEEGVVQLRVHLGLEEGKAFCFNMAPDADAVRRAHEKAGLPFDNITEVETATPGDLFFSPT